jgi:UDP-2-acetamido-2-deoxy-ribo-hexuluronate aminotransferase
MRFVDLVTPRSLYGAEIDRRMKAVLDHGQFILGPEVAEIEGLLADFVGVPHCVTVSSGTAALELALRALGIGPGDEVITPAFTWVSTAEVALLVGATPVLVDIEPASYCVDPERVRQAITPRTKAVIAVSLFGHMPDLPALAEICDARGIALIEDGAQSFGATRGGLRSCGATRIGCTSFFPSKPLGCYGDGGALFTGDAALAGRFQALRAHGAARRHEHALVGTNARFDTLQAAVLLGKWPHFAEEFAARQRLGARYTELLREHCRVPAVAAGASHAYAQYTIAHPQRDALAERLKQAGIPSAVYYPRCLHEQPALSGRALWGDLSGSEKAAREVLSLPLHPYLTEADLERVQAVIAAFSRP